MKSLFPVGLAVAFFSTNALRAQDLIGAEKVIEKVSAQQGKKGADTPDSQQALKGDLDEYRDSRLTLTPEAAADKWLALTRRLVKLGQDRYRSGGQPTTFQELVAVLPPTAGWAHLEKTLATEKAKGTSEEVSLLALRWFVLTLTGNVEARKLDYQALADKLTTLSEKDSYLENALYPLDEQMMEASDDPAYIIKLLEARLQRAIAATNKQKSFFDRSEPPRLSLPNLVTIVGEKDAETFLKKALTTYPGSLSSVEQRTLELMRRLALENIDKLVGPQWDLTQSLDAQDLYSAMLKRFGVPKEDVGFIEAQSYELARLILAGKQEEARKLQASLPADLPFFFPSGLIAYAKKTGKIDALIQYLDASLRENPALPYWNDYFAASNLDNQPDKAIALMKEALTRKDLNAETTRSIRRDLASALLASSQVDEGVAELVKLAKADLTKTEAFCANEDDTLEIARIGFLMNRPEWTKEGLALASERLAFLKKAPAPEYSYSSPALSFGNSLATTLIQIGQPLKAEEVIIEILQWREQKNADTPLTNASSDINSLLATLIGIYTDAGRSADVVTLLDRAPWWAGTDLSQIQGKSVPGGNLQRDNLGDAAARALDAVGQKDIALRIAEARIAEAPGDDRAYEQILRSGGARALPILDRLAAQYRFEERPLIWKAQILLTEGKLPEAEETIRAAIAIDPSDGEQGPGDRMRAYAVLANIREARGDAKEAEFFRNVIKAIRLSEEADQLYRLGVIGPALAMYENSLTMFADAYCIQSRLALRMNEQGRWKEAEEHYRKAYELMPDSFGRVESHCFGCEGAFTGEKPQGIADQVFTKLALEKPNSPQVHYLLGYLRESQGRPEEAMQAYQRATTLDPDYLNAWKKMASLENSLLLTTDERNAIALNLTRLDPYSRHSSLALAGVTDLGSVWTILSEADKRFTPSPKDLYPLKAATKALESFKNDPARSRYYDSFIHSTRRESSTNQPPSTSFAKASFVSTTEGLLNTVSSLKAR